MAGVSFGGGSLPHETFGSTSNGVGAAILPAGGDGRGVEFTLDGQRFVGRLPLLPRAMAMVSAYLDGDGHDVVCINAAAIAMCYHGIESRVPHWRKVYKRDLVEFGEAVTDHLMHQGVSVEEIYNVGNALRQQIFDSIPSQEEVDEEREDFTARPLDSSDGAQTVDPSTDEPAP